MKPLGIKWPSEPIKALGVFFTYDQRLLYEKNFQEKIDSHEEAYQHLVFYRALCVREGSCN